MPRSIAATLRREVAELLPPTLFFLFAFNLLALTITLMTRAERLDLVSHAEATVGALIAGKSVLLADLLPFVNRYPARPLIWNTLWKAGIYFAVTVAVRGAEALISAMLDGGGVGAALTAHAQGFDWGRFWAVQIWLAVLLVGYAAFRELSRALGPGRVRAMFFSEPGVER